MVNKIPLLILTLAFTVTLSAETSISDNFNNLRQWKKLTFPKIKSHSKYSTVKENNNYILKAQSNNSASGLINRKRFNIYKTPVVKWRWKIDNVYKKGNATRKSGDDYPIRIYIVFKYNPAKASLIERAKYNTAKLLYGKYPPHSSLNYIWANKKHTRRIITSPYTDKAKMIITRSGTSLKGKWVTEKVNVLSDYKRAFGKNPPATASIAIMSDSDNTGESATAYIDYIRVESNE